MSRIISWSFDDVGVNSADQSCATSVSARAVIGRASRRGGANELYVTRDERDYNSSVGFSEL